MKRLLNIFLCLSLSLGLTTCVPMSSTSYAYAQESEETVDEEETIEEEVITEFSEKNEAGVEEEPTYEDEETTEVNEIAEFSETSTIDEEPENETIVEEEPIVNEPVTLDVNKTKNIKDCDIILEQTSYVYCEEEIKPKVTVMYGDTELIERVDYKLSYEGNIDAGTAYVMVSGIGDFTNAKAATFEILPAKTEGLRVELSQYVYEYNNELTMPQVLVYNDEGKQLTNFGSNITYTTVDRITRTATYKLEGNVTESGVLEFYVFPRNIENVKFTLGEAVYNTKYEYMNWPNIYASDPEIGLYGNELYTPIRGYEAVYGYDEKTGLGTVTITGIDNYYGTVTLTFEIKIDDGNDVTTPTTNDPSNPNSTRESAATTTSTSETSDAVQTGDTTSYIGYVVLLLVAGGALAGLTYNSKKRHSD